MEAPMYGRGSAVTNEVNLTHSPPRARASAALRAAVLALRMAGVSVGLEAGKVSSTWSVPTPATKPPTTPSGSNVRVTESASAARRRSLLFLLVRRAVDMGARFLSVELCFRELLT